MATSSRENIKTTFGANTRPRRVMIIMIGVFVVAVVFGLFTMFSRDPAPPPETAAVPPPPGMNAVPGGSTSDRYNELQAEQNRREAELAAQQGQTTLPALVGDSQDNTISPFDPLRQPDAIPQPEPVDTTPMPEPVPDPQFQVAPIPDPQPEPQPVVQAPPAPTFDQAAWNARYANTARQLDQYMQAWAVVPSGLQEFNYTGTAAAPANPAGGVAPVANGPVVASGGAGQSSNPAASGAGQQTGNSGPSLVRAGTVIPAMLLSKVNSDNPGPVLAQVTSGPLAGARFLGQFQASEKKLVLTFNTMSKPGLGTFAVNAYAVDEQYAIGMATDVNNHYFRRYGLLLAGSLLQGYGAAMGRANTTVVTGPFGTTTTQGELSSDQVKAVALGQVGENMSQEIIAQSQVRPTVHLDCGGGCPIGLLFMSDL